MPTKTFSAAIIRRLSSVRQVLTTSNVAPCHWALVTVASITGGGPLALAAGGPAACEALATPNTLEQTVVKSAKIVASDAAKKMPAFCEVIAVVSPVESSAIGVTYRLPENWNGKMLGLGGGGWAGNVRLETAAPGLTQGYATAQTNGGHDVENVWDTAWAANPAAATDFSHRAIHVMTDIGKAVVAKYYGRAQSQAYFQGCSTGGRQGLMEVQRYPKDYDGVIAGAPVYSLTTQTMSVVRNQTFARADRGLTEVLLGDLNRAALAACDGKDGLVDGIVTDPRTCQFDPGVMQCKDNEGDGHCLSPSQVKVVRAVYAGVKNSQGETVSYPLSRASEAGWSRFISTGAPATAANYQNGAAGAGLGGLRAIVFNDANFDLAAFDPDRDYATVRHSAFATEYEAKDPDISAFVNAGGKLLLYHGWDDPGPSALATIEYFERMHKTTGPKVKALDESARLFLLPGVYHCRGGPGADTFDSIAALDRWVTHSQPPANLLATHGDGPLSRPLCVYPAQPRYKDAGDPRLAESFTCR